MSMAPTVEKYLKEQHIPYDVLPHARTFSSIRSATAAHVSPHRVAKAVLLEDEEGYMMAVLPADRHVHLGTLRRELGRRLGLATEQEIASLFRDCDLGAIPPLGEAYGVDVVVDDELANESDIYFEAGDHEELIHVRREDFLRLLSHARYVHFSTTAFSA